MRIEYCGGPFIVPVARYSAVEIARMGSGILRVRLRSMEAFVVPGFVAVSPCIPTLSPIRPCMCC